MRKDGSKAQFVEDELDVVAVCGKVFEGVQRLAEAAECFVEVRFEAFGDVFASVVDGAIEGMLDVAGGGGPSARLVRNVILHAGGGVDGKLGGVDGRTKTGVVDAGIEVIGVIFGVVDVFFGAVDTEPLGSDLKLSRSISESHERENPDQDADSARWDTLQSTNVQSLGVITKPVAKVHALNHLRGPFLAAKEGEREESVFDVAVTKVAAFDFGDGGDVAGAEGKGGFGEEEEGDEEGGEEEGREV